MAEKKRRIPKLGELGTTGLKRHGGHINEEFLKELVGKKAALTYRQMSDNDAVIGAMLFAITTIARSAQWNVVPASDSAEDVAAAGFVWDNMNGMQDTWEDTISEILSMLIYGWSYHEVVYVRNDAGQIVWKKIPIRAQSTLDRWEIAKNGDIEGMWQQDPYSGQRTVLIPIAKGLLFRTNTHKNNPEGRSLLRSAYRSWYIKRNIENLESIGIERDTAGIPVISVPSEVLDSDADSDTTAMLTEFKNIINNLRNDEQSGIIMPIEYDENNNKMYSIELMSSGGSRQFNTNEIIRRYDHRIAASVLADMIFLGSDNSAGSWALGQTKSEMLNLAIKNYLNNIKSVFNKSAIPKLMSFNSMPGAVPTLTYSGLDKVDLAGLSKFIERLVRAGIEFTDEEKDEMKKKVLESGDDKSKPWATSSGELSRE